MDCPTVYDIIIKKCIFSASLAQLDARPTGDQEDAVSTTDGSGTFFRED